jgi:acid phosphatase
MRRWSAALVGLLAVLVFTGSRTAPPRTYERLDATLWYQTAAEYRASAEQSYRLAKEMLDVALKDETWTAASEQGKDYSRLPPAVILDIDETVLDNSPFQAQLIIDNTGFHRSMWESWVRKSRARAVPGALGFVAHAKSRGVEVFYVTNREHEYESYTRSNLKRLGFPVRSKPDTVLTRKERPGWGHDKSSRRKLVASDYRILLLIGDHLNDFLSGTKVAPKERVKLAAKHKSHWGEKWILLPNPLYGNWEAALYGFAYDLPRPEKLKRKYGKLHGFK